MEQMTPWQQLFDGRVVDVDVRANDILFAGGQPVEPWNSPGIWRSTDNGQTWLPSDKGIPDSTWPYSAYDNVRRSPHNPDIVITSFGAGIFRSTDGGSNWVLVLGERGAIPNVNHVKWQPSRPGVAWFFGSTSVGDIYLVAVGDYGLHILDDVKFSGKSACDVGFDAIDPEIVYVGMGYDIIKSTEGGKNWTLLNHAASIIEGHPQIHDLLYLAGEKKLFRSSDGGQSLETIESPNQTQILSMVYDEGTESLFIGTEDGIFKYTTKK
jgi:photosystem II stability/assembly factor-like uncharacterized protein